MKSHLSLFRAAFFGTLFLALVCCGVYPLVVYGMGQALFNRQANGSLIVDAKGVIRGSALIGQSFADSKYFHPRPSAAGNGYDATSSGGSNLGPNSRKLNDSIVDRIEAYSKENQLNGTNAIPADAVTASASGLDPHISVDNAVLQMARVAKARNLDVQKIKDMMAKHTTRPDFGIFGEAGVNVLALNLALDQLK